MAHLRKHANSKFWYLRFRDVDTDVWREKSTRLLCENVRHTRAAQRMADKHSRLEAQAGTLAGAFSDWVPGYITDHYTRESTRERSKLAWERLSEWFRSKGILHPREIRHEHAREYLNWRKTKVAHNTALFELRFLAFILNEAIRLEHAERNVMQRLGIGREAAAVKPELTDDQINAARAAFAGRAEWMRVACEIQIYTGCRISEASIAMTDVDFDGQQITITDAKRKLTDKKKRYTVPLDPELAVVLKPITTDRTVPIITRGMEARYNEVMKGATKTTSHSFRVTYITRLRDAGVEERDAMELVNHSRKEVHAIYARTDTERLRPARLKLALPKRSQEIHSPT